MRAYLPSKINFNFTRIKENPYDGVENEYLSTLHRAKLKKIFRELLKTEKQSQFTNMQALTDFTTCLGRNMLNHVYSSFFVKLILKFSIFFFAFLSALQPFFHNYTSSNTAIHRTSHNVLREFPLTVSIAV